MICLCWLFVLFCWFVCFVCGVVWLAVHTDTHLLVITCEQMDERIILRDLVLADPFAWRERAALR